MLWKIKAIKPTRGFDLAGNEVDLPSGRRGYMESEAALAAAQAGTVEMLAPDGINALKAAPKPRRGTYKRRDVRAEDGAARSVEAEDEPPGAA